MVREGRKCPWDPRDWDEDDMYEPGSTLQQEFVLNLEAVPAEGVSVRATIADAINILGDHDESDDWCL